MEGEPGGHRGVAGRYDVGWWESDGVEPDALASLGDEGTDILVAIVDVVETSGVAYASRACRGKKEK